jgi:hypothetical protein
MTVFKGLIDADAGFDETFAELKVSLLDGDSQRS